MLPDVDSSLSYFVIDVTLAAYVFETVSEFASDPAAPGPPSITGAPGSPATTILTIDNQVTGSFLLNVTLQSITSGYSVPSGLPITGLSGAADPVEVTIQCDNPGTTPENGTMILGTNENGFPTYTYDLVCTTEGTPEPTDEPTPDPTDEPTPEPTDDPTPGDTLNWIAPSGNVVTIGNPLYQWTQVAGASGYEIYVGADNGSYTPANFYGTVPASLCENGVCTVDLTNTIPPGMGWLTASGEYAVFINPNPGNLTTWQGPYKFTATAPRPTVPIITEATGLDTATPALNWTLEDDATYAAFFQLYLAPTDDLNNAVLPVPTWVTREQVCGGWEGTTCSYTVPNALQSGTEYALYMQSWGMGGMSTGGLGGVADGWVEYIFTAQ